MYSIKTIKAKNSKQILKNRRIIANLKLNDYLASDFSVFIEFNKSNLWILQQLSSEAYLKLKIKSCLTHFLGGVYFVYFCNVMDNILEFCKLDNYTFAKYYWNFITYKTRVLGILLKDFEPLVFEKMNNEILLLKKLHLLLMIYLKYFFVTFVFFCKRFVIIILESLLIRCGLKLKSDFF